MFLFAYGNGGDLSFMFIIGIALHGICYDFFCSDKYIPTKSRRKVQKCCSGLITLATYGRNACWI
jgi:hypothetical protein